MRSRTFADAGSLFNRERQLRQLLARNRAREALLKVLEAKRLSKMMRNIRTKSCANLMKLVVHKQAQRKAAALRKLAQRAKAPTSSPS
jgi:hypothetical protein